MIDWELLITKCLIPIGIIAMSVAAGWTCRILRWVREDRARAILTSAIIAGYPPIGFLTIWKLRIVPQQIMLPILAGSAVVLLAMCGWMLAGRLFRDRARQGLFTLGCSMGNGGVTMAGLVIFLLMGEDGLGRSAILLLYYWPSMALLVFPIGRHFSPTVPNQSFPRQVRDSLFNIRSLGLLTASVAIVLSALRVPRPEVFSDYPVVKTMVYALLVVVYFGVGLRLHLPAAGQIKKLIFATVFVRHAVGLAIGLGFYGLTLLTAWPLVGNDLAVFLIQSSIPVGVSIPILANMYHIEPRYASSLMIVSSFLYLAIGLPILMLLFGAFGS